MVNKEDSRVTVTLFGQLGNQLWQIAFAAYLERVHKTPTRLVGDLDPYLISLAASLNIPVVKGAVRHLYKGYIQAALSPFFAIDPLNSIIQPKLLNRRVFIGYWQNKNYLTDKYISHFRNWRDNKTFELHQANTSEMRRKLAATLCVHVRLGDYIGTGHDVITPRFYSEALEIYRDKKIDKILILSNEYDKAQDLILGLNNEIGSHFEIVEHNTKSYMHDFLTMASADNLIISNSSFGWWAAFDASAVVAPSLWYKKAKFSPDFYFDNWQVLNV